MGPELLIGLQVAQGVAGFASGLSSAKSAERAGKYNQAIAGQNAIIARKRGELEAEALVRQGRKIQSAQRAAYAANNIAVDSDTAIAVMAETIADAEYEASIARYDSEVAAMGYTAQGDGARFESKVQAANFRRQAVNSLIGGFSGAGSTIMTQGADSGASMPSIGGTADPYYAKTSWL